jgi:hypothetical protein
VALLAKTGQIYKAYYSNDGSVYRFMGSARLNVQPSGAGLAAFNRGGTSADLDVAYNFSTSRAKVIRSRHRRVTDLASATSWRGPSDSQPPGALAVTRCSSR